MYNVQNKISFFILLLFSSLVMSGMLSQETFSNVFNSNFENFLFLELSTKLILVFSLHAALFLLLNNTVDELWAVALTILSLSNYNEFPFRKFLTLFVTDTKAPLISSHAIFSDLTLTLSAIVAVLTILVSTTRSFSLNLRAIISAVLTVILMFLSLWDVIFLCIFYTVYWPVHYQLKGRVWAAFATFLFGLVLTIWCATQLITNSCLENCTDAVNFYYFAAYLVVPAVAISLVYVTHRVDPFELFVRFRTLLAFFLLELTIIIVVNVDFLIGSESVPSFALAKTFLHVSYYTPVIYYCCREDVFSFNKKGTNRVFQSFRKILNVVFYIKYSEILWSMIALFLLYNLYANK